MIQPINSKNNHPIDHSYILFNLKIDEDKEKVLIGIYNDERKIIEYVEWNDILSKMENISIEINNDRILSWKYLLDDFTYGGLAITHEMKCCVHWLKNEKAILNVNAGIFCPSSRARREGYYLVKIPKWLYTILNYFNYII